MGRRGLVESQVTGPGIYGRSLLSLDVPMNSKLFLAQAWQLCRMVRWLAHFVSASRLCLAFENMDATSQSLATSRMNGGSDACLVRASILSSRSSVTPAQQPMAFTQSSIIIERFVMIHLKKRPDYTSSGPAHDILTVESISAHHYHEVLYS